MEKAENIIATLVENYGYKFPAWQSEKLKKEISNIDASIAEKLDYSDANLLIHSLARELNIDITSLLVKYKFPVWVDLLNPPNILPKNPNLVISYVEDLSQNITFIDMIEKYAEKIKADCVILNGRTQGYIQLELHRIKQYAKVYDRTLFLSHCLFIRDNAPNLFELVPIGKIGIFDDAKIKHENVLNKSNLIFLLKSEAFSRHKRISGIVEDAVKFESNMIETSYNDSVLLCDKQNAEIWSAPTFFCRYRNDKEEANTHENRAWIEIKIQRDGYEVFDLPLELNNPVLSNQIQTSKDTTLIFRYENFAKNSNYILNTWFDDNNIIGYKQKNSIDMSKFKILSLYHEQKQRESINPREYIEFINLNNIGSKFDNSFTESRIFYENFEKLFPDEFKYVGLTTGSWNMKYVGLNPIDQFHNWNAIRRIDSDIIICSDIFPSIRFFEGSRPVLREVFPKITQSEIDEFINLIGLEKIKKNVGVSNQIIAKREIVKSLFNFYQENEILDKIFFYCKKHNFSTRTVSGYERRSGYFSETVTVLWMANQNYRMMPQEILRNNWYDRKENTYNTKN